MKTLLSVLLVALLLLSCTGCALLLNLPSLEQAKDYFNNLYMQDEHESEGSEEDNYVYIADETSYGFYYDQLGEDSRVVYRSIYLDNRNTGGIPIVFREPLAFSFTADEAEQIDETVRKTICSIVQPALDALVYDHPDVSWISMDEENGSTFRVYSRRATNTDGSGSIQIRRLSFQLVYKAELTEDAIAENEAAMKAALLTAGETIEEGANRYEMLRALQEYLCRTVTYQSEAPRAHEAAGALLDGRAVCDGYARAFKLLCDAYKIPCLVVVGTAPQNGKNEPHAWNYVQMEDGKWYAMDVTWDDRGEEAKKNYFLVGSGTVTSMTLGYFESNHQAGGKFSAGDYTPFSLPELSFFRYTEPILPGNWAKEAT
jgi:transglutaminase-like putative cysteine protease